MSATRYYISDQIFRLHGYKLQVSLLWCPRAWQMSQVLINRRKVSMQY